MKSPKGSRYQLEILFVVNKKEQYATVLLVNTKTVVTFG